VRQQIQSAQDRARTQTAIERPRRPNPPKVRGSRARVDAEADAERQAILRKNEKQQGLPEGSLRHATQEDMRAIYAEKEHEMSLRQRGAPKHHDPVAWRGALDEPRSDCDASGRPWRHASSKGARGDNPTARRPNPIPLAPPPEERQKLQELSDASLRTMYGRESARINQGESAARDKANRLVCWYLWEAQRRRMHLDRLVPA
jgi:hypothetical protein